MPHVSKRKLDKKMEQELHDTLKYVLTHASSKELPAILDALLTPTEQLMIAKRLGAAFLLTRNIPERFIDEGLKLTRPTIDKIRLMMDVRPAGFQQAITEVIKLHQENEFKNLLLDFVHYLGSASGGRLPRKLPDSVKYINILNTGTKR